jgi:hypothetical protein
MLAFFDQTAPVARVCSIRQNSPTQKACQATRCIGSRFSANTRSIVPRTSARSAAGETGSIRS